MNRARRSTLGVAAGLLTLTGCGAGEVIQVGDVTVLVSEDPDFAMEALGGGPLEVVGDCLGWGDVVAIWPHGTEVVDTDPLTIDVPGQGPVSIGETVQTGGGFVWEHSSEDVEPGAKQVAGVTVPASCVEHDLWLAN